MIFKEQRQGLVRSRIGLTSPGLTSGPLTGYGDSRLTNGHRPSRLARVLGLAGKDGLASTVGQGLATVMEKKVALSKGITPAGQEIASEEGLESEPEIATTPTTPGLAASTQGPGLAAPGLGLGLGPGPGRGKASPSARRVDRVEEEDEEEEESEEDEAVDEDDEYRRLQNVAEHPKVHQLSLLFLSPLPPFNSHSLALLPPPPQPFSTPPSTFNTHPSYYPLPPLSHPSFPPPTFPPRSLMYCFGPPRPIV